MTLKEVLGYIEDEEERINKLKRESIDKIRKKFASLDFKVVRQEVLDSFNSIKRYYVEGYSSLGDPIQFNHTPNLLVEARPGRFRINYCGETVMEQTGQNIAGIYEELSSKLEENI